MTGETLKSTSKILMKKYGHDMTYFHDQNPYSVTRVLKGTAFKS